MTDDWQIDKLITRLERTSRISSTMHRISRSRLAPDDAAALRAHAALLTSTARDAIVLLKTHAVDDTDEDSGVERD